MRTITFGELYNKDYNLDEIYSISQNWHKHDNFYSCIGSPKPSHTLLWLKNCDSKVVDKAGNQMIGQKNQVLYMTKGSEYSIRFFNTHPNIIDSVVVHFQIYDEHLKELSLCDKPIVCLSKTDVATELQFEELYCEFEKNIVCYAKIKSIIFSIFETISRINHHKMANQKFKCIQKGIDILENADSNIPISEIANICSISENYFRRLFKEYSGESPTEFRLNKKIDKAKQMLSTNLLSVTDIANRLKFSDVYYFSKVFKARIGISPSSYGKQ